MDLCLFLIGNGDELLFGGDENENEYAKGANGNKEEQREYRCYEYLAEERVEAAIHFIEQLEAAAIFGAFLAGNALQRFSCQHQR